MKVRITITLDDKLLKILKKRKKEMGASVSAQIEHALRNFINCINAIDKGYKVD
jgi:metal-responsive CopG/Arc/MetJ family transcriptional regulator